MGTLGFDNTLGALFLGNLFAAISFGIACVQVYTYYRKEHKDCLAVKLLILLLWILDGTHLALISHGSYHYMVSSFGNIPAIRLLTWSVTVQPSLSATSDILIRIFFLRRVWLMFNRNIILTGCIAVTSILSFASIIAHVRGVFTLGSLDRLPEYAYFVYMALGSSTVSDILIAVSLCIALSRNRTTFKRSGSVVNELMMYTINTCLLTTLISIASLVTFIVYPVALIAFGIYYSHSKLHFNSLLAALNSRKALMEKLGGGVLIFDTPDNSNLGRGLPMNSLSEPRLKAAGAVP